MPRQDTVLLINVGSTSLKLGFASEGIIRYRHVTRYESITRGDIQRGSARYVQLASDINSWTQSIGIDLNKLSCISVRGGMTQPVSGGIWRVTPAMIEQNLSGTYGVHASNLGPALALDLQKHTHTPLAVTIDMPRTDELDTLARYSGLREIVRHPTAQTLNIRETARRFAKSSGKQLEDLRLVIIMLGGGISVVAMRDGRIIDAPDGMEGEGTFMNNRCGSLDLRPVVDMCYSGAYSRDQMLEKINGTGGLVSYLGTTKVREASERAQAGDRYAAEVLDAMCYQTAKDAGAMAAALEFDVDAVLITGGMAHIPYVRDGMQKRCKQLAPVTVIPGEFELEALLGAATIALNNPSCLQELKG